MIMIFNAFTRLRRKHCFLTSQAVCSTHTHDPLCLPASDLSSRPSTSPRFPYATVLCPNRPSPFSSLFLLWLVGSSKLTLASLPSPSHSLTLSQLIPRPSTPAFTLFHPCLRARPSPSLPRPRPCRGRASAERTDLCNRSRHIGELRQQLCVYWGGGGEGCHYCGRKRGVWRPPSPPSQAASSITIIASPYRKSSLRMHYNYRRGSRTPGSAFTANCN